MAAGGVLALCVREDRKIQKVPRAAKVMGSSCAPAASEIKGLSAY